MFTRQHYKKIAEVLANIQPLSQRASIVAKFTNLFATDNPRFDAERFEEACEFREYAICLLQNKF